MLLYLKRSGKFYPSLYPTPAGGKGTPGTRTWHYPTMASDSAEAEEADLPPSAIRQIAPFPKCSKNLDALIFCLWKLLSYSSIRSSYRAPRDDEPATSAHSASCNPTASTTGR